MARPKKAVVEYFPLVCKWGDSIRYIEDTYGIDGFVCWVKLLQKLGRTEYHYFDWKDIKQRKILCREMKLDERLVTQILDELSEFECIDEELWRQEIIFSEKFVESVKDAYKDRVLNPLFKKDIIKLLLEKNRFSNISSSGNGVSSSGYSLDNQNEVVSSSGNPQSKLKETIENEIKEKETSSNEPQIECEKDDDVFFKKFLLSLSVVKAYPLNEDSEKVLWDKILKIQPNQEKALEIVEKWTLQVLNENPIKNDPRIRLFRWVETDCEEEIKARKAAELVAEKRLEEQRKNAEVTENINAHKLIKNECLNSVKDRQTALDFLARFENKYAIGHKVSNYAKDFIKKFNLTWDEIQQAYENKAELRG